MHALGALFLLLCGAVSVASAYEHGEALSQKHEGDSVAESTTVVPEPTDAVVAGGQQQEGDEGEEGNVRVARQVRERRVISLFSVRRKFSVFRNLFQTILLREGSSRRGRKERRGTVEWRDR